MSGFAESSPCRPGPPAPVPSGDCIGDPYGRKRRDEGREREGNDQTELHRPKAKEHTNTGKAQRAPRGRPEVGGATPSCAGEKVYSRGTTCVRVTTSVLNYCELSTQSRSLLWHPCCCCVHRDLPEAAGG